MNNVEKYEVLKSTLKESAYWYQKALETKVDQESGPLNDENKLFGLMLNHSERLLRSVERCADDKYMFTMLNEAMIDVAAHELGLTDIVNRMKQGNIITSDVYVESGCMCL